MTFFQEKTGEFYVEVNQLNHLNILHGGELFKRCDTVIGRLASKYAHSRVLTVSVKAFDFTKTAIAGDFISFNVSLLSTSHKTMTFYAEIISETFERQPEIIGEAIFVFVAVDKELKTTAVEMFMPQDPEQVHYIQNIQKRFHLN